MNEQTNEQINTHTQKKTSTQIHKSHEMKQAKASEQADTT